MSGTCPHCDGWRWCPSGPEGEPLSAWHRHGWRILIEPDLRWQRCACSPPGNRSRLQEVLAHLLLQRLDEAIDTWESRGGWEYGRIGTTAAVWRHRDIYCLERPGAAWVLASPMGVMRDLSASGLARHLIRAGAPPLP